MISFDLSYSQLLLFILLLTRASGIFIFTPFLGNVLVPVHVRVLLSAVLGYFLYLSNLKLELQFPFSPGNLLVGILGELLIGMVIGFAAHILFNGLQLGAHLIGFQMGLSFVNLVDPSTSNRSTTLGIIYNFLGLMLFLGFNGHHWFIESIARSVMIAPPYGIHWSGMVVNHLGSMFGRLFVIGFQLAAPLVTVLLITDVALGIAGRSAQQINVLVIGFPLKVLVGLVCLGLGLYFLPVMFKNYSFQLYHDINTLIGELGR
jgi:flagellar biosynthesis protein FliR